VKFGFTTKNNTKVDEKMKRLVTLCGCLLLATVSHGATDGLADFKPMKYGFFVHYVWGGDCGGLTVDRTGKVPANFDALVDGFDVAGFANDLSAWQVEYVILTAWHANINPLFPSATMKKWGLDKHVCKRDLLGEVIRALKIKGIKVIFYTHPRDGHDLRGDDRVKTGWGLGGGVDPDVAKFERKKWNDFTNELYGELVDRYGKDITGLYLDEGSPYGDSEKVVDYPRLRDTIKSRAPHLVLLQNFFGNLYTCDVGSGEYTDLRNQPPAGWNSGTRPLAPCIASSWLATAAADKFKVSISAEDMFRYTVLQAGVNSDGGGVQWATGPYVGGGWETGVDDVMRKLGAYIKPVAEAIKQTYPSTSYLTPGGRRMPDLAWGVATKSVDDRFEYVHVLRPPADGGKLVLPPPADGKHFASATLLLSGQPVSLKQDASGLTLTLPAKTEWNKLDTVLKLAVATDSPPVNVAQWKAFKASSSANTPGHPIHLNDGDENSAWVSAPSDKQAWGQVDLGRACRITRLEVSGSIAENVEVRLSQTADFKNSKVLASRPVSTAALDITIKKATYGAGERTVDVTDKVRAAIGKTTVLLPVGVALIGYDPALGSGKELRVTYSLAGKQQDAVVSDGQTLRIGNFDPWVVELPVRHSGRFVRVARVRPGEALSIQELKVYGKYEDL